MPNDLPVQDPPPLIQDPEPNLKTITIPTPRNVTVKFDVNKVLAVVGLILVLLIVVIGIMWIWLQALQGRVDSLEESTTPVKITKIATPSASSPATNSATPSAN